MLTAFHIQSSLRKKKFIWPVFSRIWPEYGEILRISAYSVQMRENTDQKNSEYGHFLRSEQLVCKQLTLKKNTVETIRNDAITRFFSLNLKFNR